MEGVLRSAPSIFMLPYFDLAVPSKGRVVLAYYIEFMDAGMEYEKFNGNNPGLY